MLEESLDKACGLKRCTVAATRHLTRVLESGHGRTLAAVVERQPAMNPQSTRFVSLLGSLTRRSATNPFDRIAKRAERTGGEGFFMPVPFLVSRQADAQALRAQRGV